MLSKALFDRRNKAKADLAAAKDRVKELHAARDALKEEGVEMALRSEKLMPQLSLAVEKRRWFHEHVGLSRVLGQFEADLGRSALAAAMGGTEKADAGPDFEVLLRAIREQPEGDFGG